MLLRETTVVDIQYNKKYYVHKAKAWANTGRTAPVTDVILLTWQKMTSATPSSANYTNIDVVLRKLVVWQRASY